MEQRPSTRVRHVLMAWYIGLQEVRYAAAVCRLARYWLMP